MFLVVMALSFLTTVIVMKDREHSDMEKIIVDHEVFSNSEELPTDKQVYILENYII